ncbi:hypothetical protein EVAR_95704_1 [Eumeta japonica]|uniref:Uncharacterized protein n=1 Tax=Eumeta variegata TaxID=151549 RepID=A0A4C1VM51_EUMVA|nr:hypothetical protein EVAR_95704_1 [Eumeta japonica]
MRPGLRLTSIDIKNETIHSMSMQTELRTSTEWASHPQETAEQRLPDQLANEKTNVSTHYDTCAIENIVSLHHHNPVFVMRRHRAARTASKLVQAIVFKSSRRGYLTVTDVPVMGHYSGPWSILFSRSSRCTLGVFSPSVRRHLVCIVAPWSRGVDGS